MGHIFPFSPKRGTPAARMPQVPPADRQSSAPAACARPARRARRRGWRGWSARGRGCWSSEDGSGHAENFAPVQIRHSSESWNPAARGKDPSFRWSDGEIVESHRRRRKRHPDRSARVTETSLVRAHAARLPARPPTGSATISPGCSTKAALDEATLDEIEEALIASDLGPATAAKVRARLAEEKFERGLSEAAVREVVARSWRRSSRRSPSRSRSTPSRARR